jgi:hypothetical protein
MEVATLTIAIIGAVTGVGSLAWQVVAFTQSGPRVNVTAFQALLMGGGSDADDWHVNVTAFNSGRAPVTVKGWGFRMPNGKAIHMISNLSLSASLPHRLEPGSDANWYMPTAEVQRYCTQLGVRHQDITAYVNLADASTVNAKKRGIGLA